MKNIQIMSKSNAQKLSYKPDIEDCIVISITDVEDTINKFHNNPKIKSILRLQFDDVDKGKLNCMTEDDANKIINFVDRYINSVDTIIVHCGAGVSRSAGVAAALMLILNGSDKDVFNNGKYRPNMTCYRLVLESYFGKYGESIPEEKAHNIAAYRKLYLE